MNDLNSGQVIALLFVAAALGYWIGMQKAWSDADERQLRTRIGALETAEAKRQYEQAVKEGKIPARPEF
jgi:hypothetical protein